MSSAVTMRFGAAQFRYEPFPVGIARKVFDDTVYDELLNTFPAVELFRHMQDHGSKYSLSELNNPDQYFSFLKRNRRWHELYAYVKSQAFVADTLELLRSRNIDLGLRAETGRRKDQGIRRRLANLLLGKTADRLSARFEFSMMPAQGGHILPHTDSPQKIITLVVSMLRPGEWRPEWGGGTDVMRALDPANAFNLLNRQLAFDDVVVIDSFAFEPNQCVIFIKTFNSLHAVRAMRGPPGALRRTLTINIESTQPVYPA